MAVVLSIFCDLFITFIKLSFLLSTRLLDGEVLMSDEESPKEKKESLKSTGTTTVEPITGYEPKNQSELLCAFDFIHFSLGILITLLFSRSRFVTITG